MKVIALRDVAYLHERVENWRCVVGEQVLPAGTILDVVPMAAGAIRSVATPRDDLREIARFARIEKQFGMEVANAARRNLPAGSSRAKVTTLSARWSAAAEEARQVGARYGRRWRRLRDGRSGGVGGEMIDRQQVCPVWLERVAKANGIQGPWAKEGERWVRRWAAIPAGSHGFIVGSVASAVALDGDDWTYDNDLDADGGFATAEVAMRISDAKGWDAVLLVAR